MKTSLKILLFGILGFAIAVPLYRNFAGFTKLNFSIRNFRLGKLSLTGLPIHVDSKIINPTRGTMKISQPFVKIVCGLNNEQIAISNVTNKEHTIQPNSETSLDTISIQLPILTLVNLATKLKSGLSVNLKNQLADKNFVAKLAVGASSIGALLKELQLKAQFTAYGNNVYYESDFYPLI
ncbi:MAG: hypothetical protein FWE63_02015 [Bacteroidales bacterium]|nr:hypothetical protein [Bacteroidales bacterium]